MKNCYKFLLSLLSVALAGSAHAQLVDASNPETKYKTFADAVKSVQSDAVFNLIGPVDCNSNWKLDGKEITIIGTTPDAALNMVLANDGKHRGLFQMQNADDRLTLRNLTVNCSAADYSPTAIQNQSGTLSLENVTFNGFNCTNELGMVRCYGTSTTTFDNVRFVNCTAKVADVVVAGVKPVINGDCRLTVSLTNNAAGIKDDGFDSPERMAISVPDNRAAGQPIVEGTTDIFKFNLVTPTASTLMLAPATDAINVIKYQPVLICRNDGTYKSFATLDEAAQAVTNNVTMLVVNEDVTLSNVFKISDGLVIRGLNPKVTITRDAALTGCFLTANSGNNVTVRDLVFQGVDGADYTSWMMQANGGTLNINNVIVRDMTTILPENSTSVTMIRATATDGSVLNINGLKIQNCELPGDNYQVVVASAGSSIAGDNSFVLRLNKDVTINGSGLQSAPESIMLSATGLSETAPVILNCSDPSTFDLLFTGWSLVAGTDGNLVAYKGEPVSLGIPQAVLPAGSNMDGQIIHMQSAGTIQFTPLAGTEVSYTTRPFSLDDFNLIATADAEDVETEPNAYTSAFDIVTQPETTIIMTVTDTAHTWRKPAAHALFVLSGAITGIEDIPVTAPGAAAPAYYDLQGRRVAQPSHGLYIRVEDGRATKILLH